MFNWPLWCVPYMECKPYSMIAKSHTRGPDYILAHCACEVVRPLPSPAMVLPYLTIILPKSSMTCHTVTWHCPTMDRPYPTIVLHSPTMALPYSIMDHHGTLPWIALILLGSALLYQVQPYSAMDQPYAMRGSVIYVLYWWFCHTMPDPTKVYNCLGPMYVFLKWICYTPYNSSFHKLWVESLP